MSIKSPGYKSYTIEGSNLSIPGWLIKHRGESIDKAVTAATNALVLTDVQRNKVFGDRTTNPQINAEKSFTILSVIPTEVPEVGGRTNSTCLDNKFQFTLIDERFINPAEKHSKDNLRAFFRYKSKNEDESNEEKDLNKIVENYEAENPTLSTLWGTIKTARDYLQSQPYNIANANNSTIDKYQVLLTDIRYCKDCLEIKEKDPTHICVHPKYGKVTAAHIDDSVRNGIIQANHHLYGAVDLDITNTFSKEHQLLAVKMVDGVKDLHYSYITDSNIDSDSELWGTIKTARYVLETSTASIDTDENLALLFSSKKHTYGKVSDSYLSNAVVSALNLARKYLASSSEGGGPAEYTVLASGAKTGEAFDIKYTKINEDYLADEIFNVVINCNDASIFDT